MFFFNGTEDLRVVGLSGKARSGKDWLVKSVAWQLGFVPIAFASHFKTEIAARHSAYSIDEVFGLQERSPKMRQLLQTYGTEEGRNEYGEDIWIRHTEAWMYHFYQFGYKRFIITDVRFPNEAAWVKRLNGSLIRVTGRGGLSGSLGQHSSENSLDGYEALFDVEFDNSPENELTSVQRFRRVIREVADVA